MLSAGCVDTTVGDLQRRIAGLEQTIEQKDQQIAAQKANIDQLNERVSTALGFPPDRLKYLFYPESLAIDSLSGGYNDDDRPGDDGVVVYLRPLDRSGDVVKVAGQIRIELYDLANPPERNLLGECGVPIEKAGEHWYGKLMTYHYRVRCPWRSGPPAHPDITVRATFIDALLGRIMTAQAVVKVNLPP